MNTLNEAEIVKYPLNANQRAKFYEFIQLRAILPSFSKRRVFGLIGPSVYDLKKAVSCVSEAQATFWDSVIKRWPELQGKQLTADANQVLVNE